MFNPEPEKYMPTPEDSNRIWDAIVIGSGFGGGTTAMVLSLAGKSVLLIERGPWAKRDESGHDESEIIIKKRYKWKEAVKLDKKGKYDNIDEDACVGGKSLFFGGVMDRFKIEDFRMRSNFPAVSSDDSTYVDWPISYDDLEPFYSEAEQLYEVSGDGNADKSASYRSKKYPYKSHPLGKLSAKLAKAGESIDFNPYPLPMALNFNNDSGGRPLCDTGKDMLCDMFLCMIMAKNDVSQMVLPQAVAKGVKILSNTLVVKILHEGREATGVEIVDCDTKKRRRLIAKTIIVSGGAVPSAKLLMVSGIESNGKGKKLIGRNLMIHCVGISGGLMLSSVNGDSVKIKQVGFNDYYHGNGVMEGHLGTIQGPQRAPVKLISERFPTPLKKTVEKIVHKYIASRMLNMIVITEDLPRESNGVYLTDTEDEYGVSMHEIRHNFTKRDIAARKILFKEARRILRRSGCFYTQNAKFKTLSHAVGTCRFGEDPDKSVLDVNCKLHGWKNLYIVDGSFFPTSSGMNPSLTITANALRVSREMLKSI